MVTQSQQNFAVEVFCDAADQDYLLARIAFRYGLLDSFLWNANQAIEKYLKCSLVLNGISSQGIGHDLKRGLDSLPENCRSFLPSILIPPSYFPLVSGKYCYGSEPFEKFVNRIGSMGKPAIRYRQSSYSVGQRDFHKFDEVCFQLRRICVPLDGTSSNCDLDNLNELRRNPRLQPNGGLIGWATSANLSRKQMAVLKWRNFSYFETEAKSRGKLAPRGATVNSPLFRFLKQDSAEKKSDIKWALRNIDFNKELAIALGDAAKD